MIWISKIVYFICFLLIKAYQYVLSPAKDLFFGPIRCRFSPSCSQYALESLRTKGIRKGLMMTIKRLSRCHPWYMGGDDPVK